MNTYTELNKYFSKCLGLMITQMSVQSMEPATSWLPAGQVGLKIYKRQELKLELVPLGLNADRTYNLTLAVDDSFFNCNEIAFDSTDANIPEDITGRDRVVMRLGYMIYQSYLATKGSSQGLQNYPSYLVDWSVSMRMV